MSSESPIASSPDIPSDAPARITFRVKGRILHTTSRGPYKNLVGAIPANVNEVIDKLVQQGCWGQIVIYEHSALITPAALEDLRVHLRQRYLDPARRPVTALVFGPEVEGGLSMGPKFQQCFLDAGVECRLFLDYQTALDWVGSQIRQSSVCMAWSDNYRLGEAGLDEQHQELFRRATYVLGATSHHGQVVAAMRLFQYMRAHISYEDELMRHSDYPDIEMHRRQHRALIERLNELSLHIANERLVLHELEDFIAQLFRVHMDGDDRKLVDYLQAHSARR